MLPKKEIKSPHAGEKAIVGSKCGICSDVNRLKKIGQVTSDQIPFAGKWYLIRGDLADFLEAIYVGANPAFRSYYRLLSGMRGLNFFLRQHLLTYFYTRKVASRSEERRVGKECRSRR